VAYTVVVPVVSGCAYWAGKGGLEEGDEEEEEDDDDLNLVHSVVLL
jgi:hypothetical protein